MRKITVGSNRKIFALRGNLPLIDQHRRDPYRHNSPGEITDDGLSPLTNIGDESGRSGSSSVGGTTAREGYPRNTTSKDDYELQRQDDIPVSDHMFIGTGKNQRQLSPREKVMREGDMTGVDSTQQQQFTDPSDRLVTDKDTWGDQPRIQNMSELPMKSKRSRQFFNSLQKSVKGVYNG